MSEPLLEVTDLTVSFPTDTGELDAVRGLSYHVAPREVVAMVGESGSGKSAAAMAVIGLLPEYAEVSGSVRLGGRELLGLSDAEMSQIRGRRIGTVFQDPMSALTPVYTVGDQIAEAAALHLHLDRNAAMKRALEMLELVEIPAARQRLHEYPHQLSGGMRQRVMIALALSCNPSLLIADEPTTALDVTIQAQILALLDKLRHEIGMAVLFVTHNLGVVAEIADRVVVMYSGRVVEEGDVRQLFGAPRHPYTRALLRSVPDFDERRAHLESIVGMPPDLIRPPSGCRFHPRCEIAHADCSEVDPELIQLGDRRATACRYHEELAPRA